MLKRIIFSLAALSSLAVMPSSILPSNAGYQSDDSEKLVAKAREAHRRAHAKFLSEHLREFERNSKEARQAQRKADFAYHHRLRAASDSFVRSRSSGKNDEESFRHYIVLTEAAEIEHALQTFRINENLDESTQRNSQSLDDKLRKAERRLEDVFRKIGE